MSIVPFDLDLELAKRNLLLKDNQAAKLAEAVLHELAEKVEESLERIFKKLNMDPIGNLTDRQICRWVSVTSRPGNQQFYIGGIKVLECEIRPDGSYVIWEAQ